MLLLGRMVSGAEAAEWGMVHGAVDPLRASTTRRRSRRDLAGRADRRPRAHQLAGAHRPFRRWTTISRTRKPSRWSCRRAARTSARASPRSGAGKSGRPNFDGRSEPTRRRQPAGRPRHTPTRRSVMQCARGSTSTCRSPGATPPPRGRGRDPRGAHAGPSTRRGIRCSARSGLVVPTWPVEYGGLGLDRDGAPGRGRAPRRTTSAGSTRSGSTSPRRRSSRTAPRSSGCASCRRSCATKRCGASSSASRAPAPTSPRWRPGPSDGDEWIVTGQKVWTTWAHLADYGVLLARTDPDVPKRHGITYFLLDLHQPGVDVRPLRHITGEIDFNEVFLDGARVPDTQRSGDVGDGWRVANATLSGERQMVSGAGSGGVDRIGGSGVNASSRWRRQRAGSPGGWADPVVRTALMRLYSEERIRDWTNQRVPSQLSGSGRARARRARSARCTRRAEPADPAAGRRSARSVRRRVGERRRRVRRVAAVRGARDAAQPRRTRSRAAPPRSTRTSSASGCSASPRARSVAGRRVA